MRKLMRLLGIDRAVFFGVLSKLWLAAAGVVTIFMIAAFFSRELQGYYFTFLSLLALQVFVELGLGVVITNFSSHEWAKLSLDKNGMIIGDTTALSRLKSLYKIAFYWYLAGAMLLAIVLGAAGYIFFSLSGQSSIDWAGPWLALCFFTGVNLSVLPNFAILEGCGQIAEVYYYRFIYGIVRFVATWIIIALGGGLWSAVGAIFFPLIWTFIFLYKKYLAFFKILFAPGEGLGVSWRNEIWPMQWKIAVSWLSGYFFFSLFTPILFHYQGPVAAGQMGMTWSMVNTLSMIASMWITARIPQFGLLIAQKEFKKLDRLIFRSTLISIAVALLGAGAIFALVVVLFKSHHPFALRFLSPLPTALFLAATVAMQISFGQSSYLRSHKKEPFVWLSVISAVLMAVGAVIVGGRWGALGIAFSYFVIVMFFNIPYGTYIWNKCRKEWYPETDQEVITYELPGL